MLNKINILKSKQEPFLLVFLDLFIPLYMFEWMDG